ncbi:MAG TPA: isoprenylcysteine carboxylmethyltransferase family protein [Candidatus Saccharimonadales bacterium]|nr:isoprenylcysteine carboxylmethyltransferase family protein [Candidatus Saccharimonadales bacterium]
MDNDRKAVIFNSFGILSSVFILISGRLFSTTAVDLLVQIFGLLLIIWAAITIKVSREKQHHLSPGYFFLTRGPYEIIRHPVYAGYLLVMISFVEVEFTFLRLIALAILCATIFLKIVREESIMKEDVQEYKDYMKKTKALIPYLL